MEAGTDVDAGIAELSNKFSVDLKVATSATEIFDYLLLKCPEEFGLHDRLSWLTCLVYTVAVDQRYPYGLSDPHLPDTDKKPQIELGRLLRAANISVKTFFQRLSVIREYCFLSDAVQQTVRKLEKNYCVLTVLYNKLEKIMAASMVKPERGTSLSEQLQLADFRKRMDLCWSIFLASRVELVPSEQELCTALAILLCCVMVVVSDTPPFSLRPPFDTLCEEFDDDDAERRRRVLRTLCELFGANLNEVEQLHEQYWIEFESSLPKEDDDYDIEKIHQKYLSSYEVDSDVNALLFLDNDDLLYPDDLWTGKPCRDKTPTTPVSGVLSCVQHLDHIIAHLEDAPSEKLAYYCKQCSKDPSSSMDDRLNELETRFVREYRANLGIAGRNVPVQRFRSARKLYYHVLELLLKIEEEKLGHSDFSKLLNHDVFHRSLLACSLEIVLVSYRLTYNPLTGSPRAHCSTLSFPWILTVTEIAAYDFHKVIESFIRAEPRLTREVVKHLQLIENQILDSSVWKEDSPLFAAIARAEGDQLPAVLTCPSPAKHLPAQAVSQQDIYSSPCRPAAGQGDVQMGVQPRSTSLTLFYNKVSQLAYHRLTLLCDKLDIDKDQQRRIWTCLQYCITHKPALLKNRHLDQIMLCSIYAVCRVSSLDVTFKNIVGAYRRLDNTSPMIYKAVRISEGLYDSIVGFYNDVFLEPMKKVVMDFLPQRPNPPLSPVPPLRHPPSTSPTSSYRAKRNFYVSPLKSSPFKVPLTPSKMTPRMKRLYSFGEQSGSSLVLRSINDSMQQMSHLKFTERRAQPRSLKRLKFDPEPEQASDGGDDESAGASLFARRLAETRGSATTMEED